MPRTSEREIDVQDFGPVASRDTELADTAVSFTRFKQEIDMAPILAGLPTRSCQCPHWGCPDQGRCDGAPRSGSQFDPVLVETFVESAQQLLADLDAARTWRAVVDAEPALGRRLADDEIDDALVAVADFVDLKSPYTLGHARAVADLNAGAGADLTLPPQDVRTLRRACFVHALGRLGVSKIGTSSRAGASLFAMRHGLLATD
jgi:hypothetical protein